MSAIAQHAVQKDKIVPLDRQALSHFGFTVAISGEYAMVGTFSSAYIFEEQAGGHWNQVAKLTNPDGQGGGFGRSLFIDGRYAFVGASGADHLISGEVVNDAGAVYVFYRDGTGKWVFSAKLTSDSPKASGFFGNALSASNGTLAIGSYGDETNAGKVFLYSLNAEGKWVLTQKLLASDKSSAYFFGKALSLTDRQLLITAASPGTKGRVYHFVKNDASMWIEVQKIFAPAESANGFGRAITSLNGVALISDESEKAVHAFKQDSHGSWRYTDILRPSGTAPDNLFGGTIALTGSLAVVGAPWEHEHQQGVVYLYQTTDSVKWVYLDKIMGSISSSGDEFGYSLGVSNNKMVVGSYLDEKDETGGTLLERAGSAYVFELSSPRPPKSVPPNQRIPVENCTPILRDFTIPNVITPNGDGSNECFVIAKLYDRTSLFVYDRYGREVYRTENYSNDWCGGELATGVYYWTIIQHRKHCHERLKGWIQVMR